MIVWAKVLDSAVCSNNANEHLSDIYGITSQEDMKVTPQRLR